MRIGTLDRFQCPDTTANITIEREGRTGGEETLYSPAHSHTENLCVSVAYFLCALCVLRVDCSDTLLASIQRVDEWGDGARLRKHDEQPEQDEHDNDRDEPVLLLLTKEGPELGEDTALAHISLRTCADSAGGRDSESGTASIPGFLYGVRAGLCRSGAR